MPNYNTIACHYVDVATRYFILIILLLIIESYLKYDAALMAKYVSINLN